LRSRAIWSACTRYHLDVHQRVTDHPSAEVNADGVQAERIKAPIAAVPGDSPARMNAGNQGRKSTAAALAAMSARRAAAA
jgi:hypothetical protein